MPEAERKPLFAWQAPAFSDTVASIRIRCIQVMVELGQMGLRVEKFSVSRPSPYNAVVFSKAYRTSDLEVATRLKREGVSVVFDICDDHIYAAKTSPVLDERASRLQQMLNLADRVVVSTVTLGVAMAEYFPLVAGKITVIPDALDPLVIKRGSTKGRLRLTDSAHLWRIEGFLKRRREALKLVWFGNHGVGHAQSGMADLLEVRSALEDYAATKPLTLTVISNSYRKYLSVCKAWQFPTCYVPWRLATFTQVLALHDVAILPVSRNPFTLAKTNNRPATAVLSGLGVIADSIPSYEELNPYIWLDDWPEGLIAYAEDTAYELSRLEKAKQYLFQKYSGAAIANQWRDLLLSLQTDDSCRSEVKEISK